MRERKNVRKNKVISFLLAFIMVLSILPTKQVKAEDVKEEGNLLTFKVIRPEYPGYERPTATYANYWMSQPENDVFDRATWALKDFSIEYELHIEGANRHGYQRNVLYSSKLQLEWRNLI